MVVKVFKAAVAAMVVGILMGAWLGYASIGFGSGTILLAVVVVIIGSFAIPFVGGQPGFATGGFLYAFAASLLAAAMLTA